MVLVLHGYWRSGTSYRTRIGLELKGLAYVQRSVDLRAGDQKSPGFLALNPQGLVPALEIDGRILTQSTAILEYLEETRPDPPLLPKDPGERAEVRAMAAVVACDIHPLNNLRVLKAVRAFAADDPAGDGLQAQWTARWIRAGFDALEQMIAGRGRGWAWGDTPTLVDCCLIPQVYSARRFGLGLSDWPRIAAIDARAADHPAFIAAHPERQPDAD